MSGNTAIREAIRSLSSGSCLGIPAAGEVMQEIISGSATDAQVGAFLAMMQVKGPSIDEIASFARVLREDSVPVNRGDRQMILDTCGTGGDGRGSFNISTATAFVAAGAGVPVIKHGNRSASGRCGSADVLEALGVNLALPPVQVDRIFSATGIAFAFAPAYHPGMARVAAARQELGIRTVFNILGPLLNPASADAQLLGVFDPGLTRIFAEVLRDLGTTRAMVVHGAGLDEITTTGETRISCLSGGRIVDRTLHPGTYGIGEADPCDIAGGDAVENARILTAVLSGEKGAHRDIVILNSAAAICIAGRSSSIREGIGIAASAIDDGRAQMKLDQLVEASGVTV